MNTILKCENLNFSYKTNVIFDNANFEIYEQDFTFLIGKNSCGKTTLIKILASLLPHEGTITINSTILDDTTKHDIRKQTAYILENMSDFFVCDTVIDEIAFSMENLNYSQSRIDDNIKQISKTLNITHLLNKSIKVLSGGEKQLIALASVLVTKPTILIIDDGLSSLDNYEKKNVLELLKRLNKEEKLTIILSTNEFDNIEKSNNIIVVEDKKIITYKNAEILFEDSNIVKKLKIELPFIVDLSTKLKLYNLVDKIEFDNKKLVDKIWK